MALFHKKKEQPSQPIDGTPASAPVGIPTQEVDAMRQQGYSNDQIVQALQNKGYKSDEVYDAMSQADIGQHGGPVPMQQQPPMPAAAPPPQEMPPTMEPPAQDRSISAPEKERIEEVAEVIIDEKWKDLMGDMGKIVEWKRVIDSRLDKLEQLANDLKTNFDNLHKGVLGRISEYDKNLTNVGVEIKAMEKVFQKVLPTFTENVNKLSRFVKK